MYNYLNALYKISQTTGTNSQMFIMNIISENDCEEFRYILNWAFNPFWLTHINKVTIDQNVQKNVNMTFDQFKTLMEHLRSLPAANDLSRSYVNDAVSRFNGDNNQLEMLIKLITKSMNIGVGAKLINKALNTNLIPDSKMMKAEDDISLIQDFTEMYVDEKFDGVRVWAEITGGKVVAFRTYEFREIDINCLQNLKSQIEDLIISYPTNNNWLTEISFFVDGELTGQDRQSVSGQVTKILKGTAPVDIDKNFVYHIFDLDELETLKNGKGRWVYKERKNILEQLFENKNYPNIRLVQSTLCETEDQMYAIFNDIIARKGEGVIIKNSNHVYECKRSKNWVKMKEVNECDLRIVSYYDGKGKRLDKNLIGGLICMSDDGMIKVDVGGGYSDELLEEISKNLNEYMGKIASIKYNVKIKSKNSNTWSLFLPRLSEVRFDKKETDVFEKIK